MKMTDVVVLSYLFELFLCEPLNFQLSQILKCHQVHKFFVFHVFVFKMIMWMEKMRIGSE